ncbi:MAG: hypothetical protein WGN25_12775 [Candidatus Electrothrix sp. GW3-4]|uniref:hypothetical protein n=1 Tax=Candidatus Electrothrix sp. GW3-4 TaxID=3126740 RepID=UPI0030D09EDA
MACKTFRSGWLPAFVGILSRSCAVDSLLSTKEKPRALPPFFLCLTAVAAGVRPVL